MAATSFHQGVRLREPPHRPRPSIFLMAVIALAACRSPETWRGQGDLVSVGPDGAVIAHDAIPGVLEAATTRFRAQTPAVLANAQPGTRVDFELVREGTAFILARMDPIAFAKTVVGTLDSGPRFGGVVDIVGATYLEVAATPDGRVRAWLSDLWRRPVPLRDVTGTVQLKLPEGSETAPFAAAGANLEARLHPFTVESALATIALVRGGQPLEANVLLDLTGNRAGAPIVPQTGCVVPSRAPTTGRGPRCTVTFPQTFSATGVLASGARFAVAIGHGATTIWKLPEATLLMGLDPPPPHRVEPGKHEPDPRVLAARPDGTEILMAIGSEILVYDAATGRIRRSLEGPGGTIGTAVWRPDASQILVVASADGEPRLVDAGDGHVVRTLDVPNRVVAAAIDGSGRWAAAGTEVGTIALADLQSETPQRLLTPSLQPVAALAFAGTDLVSAGSDGTLRVYDVASGRETARTNLGAPLVALAISSDGRLAATANAEHVIMIHRMPRGAVAERLQWHQATISALAWGAGPTLVSGDNDGQLAVWDMKGP